MQENKYDAILVHGYWLSQRGDGRIKPSLRSHLSNRAVANLYRHGNVDNIILTAGYTWSNDYPSQAEVMKTELVRKYKIPESSVHIVPEGTDTYEETRLFLELADENGWKKLADIGFKTHQHSVRRTYEIIGRQAELMHTEEILMRDDIRVQNLVRGLNRSIYELNFKLYEHVKRLMLIISPDYKLLGKFAKRRYKKKGPIAVPFSFGRLPIDKYDL